MPWFYREIPGLVLVGAYMLGGAVVAWGLYRATRRTTPYWRWATLTLVLQLAAAVPIKILCRYVLDVKYVIALPEYGFNL